MKMRGTSVVPSSARFQSWPLCPSSSFMGFPRAGRWLLPDLSCFPKALPPPHSRSNVHILAFSIVLTQTHISKARPSCFFINSINHSRCPSRFVQHPTVRTNSIHIRSESVQCQSNPLLISSPAPVPKKPRRFARETSSRALSPISLTNLTSIHPTTALLTPSSTHTTIISTLKFARTTSGSQYCHILMCISTGTLRSKDRSHHFRSWDVLTLYDPGFENCSYPTKETSSLNSAAKI